MPKIDTPATSLSRHSLTQTEGLSGISEETIKGLTSIMNHWIDAGASNLMQGYAQTIVMTDMLHNAGMVTDAAYDAVFILATIIEGIAGVTSLTDIFGANSPFTPQLKTKVEQSTNATGETETKSTTEATGKAAQALSSLVPAVVAAIG